MKRKFIQDWKTLSKEEMFLYRLENKPLHFYHVDEDEILEFCRFCIDKNLLKFHRQKEYAGTIAQFYILEDFNIQWKPTGFTDNRPVFTLAQGDVLILTELLHPTIKKRAIMNLYDEWRISVDIPTEDSSRTLFYEDVKKILCE